MQVLLAINQGACSRFSYVQLVGIEIQSSCRLVYWDFLYREPTFGTLASVMQWSIS